MKDLSCLCFECGCLLAGDVRPLIVTHAEHVRRAAGVRVRLRTSAAAQVGGKTVTSTIPLQNLWINIKSSKV